MTTPVDDGSGAEQEQEQEQVLVLAPSVARAAGWTLVGAIAIASAGWSAGRTTGTVALLAAFLLVASVAMTVPFAMQTFAPRSWTLRLAGGRLWGHAAAFPVDVALDDVVGHRVGRLLGDHALRIEVGRRRRWILLPVGADVGALRRALDESAARPSPAAAGDIGT